MYNECLVCFQINEEFSLCWKNQWTRDASSLQPMRLLHWKPQWQGIGWPYVDQEKAICSFLKVTSEVCDVNQKTKDVHWVVAEVHLATSI